MSAHALRLPTTTPANLRPFDARRDLLAVADLVELCFSASLDADGRSYIQQMRQAARRGGWQPVPTYAQDDPLMGMVWVEDGQVVGNLSLIAHRRVYLIANVAVHPDHRRRGIASQLTLAALQDIRRRGVQDTWLQVDENNPTAVNLYRRLGFVERLRRTSWRTQPGTARAQAGERVMVRARQGRDWELQKSWLDASYPPQVRWQLPLEPGVLQPGLLGGVQRVFSERRTLQWSGERRGELQGVLIWQSSALEADRLWLAAPPQHEDDIIAPLMRAAQHSLYSQRKLALNYPAGRAVTGLQQAGFSALRSLIWMQYPWESTQ